MNRSFCLALALVSCVSVPSTIWADPLTPITTAPPHAPVEKESSLGALISLLDKYAAGERVLAVGTGRMEIPQATGISSKTPLLARLQAIGETASQGDALIPFRVGSSWAVAPSEREVLNPDLHGISADDAESRGLLLQRLLVQLTPAQVRDLGSSAGLEVATLPRSARSILGRVLRTPMDVCRCNGLVMATPVIDDSDVWPKISSIEWPLDPARLRIRAQLRVPGAGVDAGEASGNIWGSLPAGLLELRAVRHPVESLGSGVDVPLLVTEPNAYRACDLSTKAFTQPIGLEGVGPLAGLVHELKKATGLKLYVGEFALRLPVFIGSKTMTCGEVLDGLRLALTGTWRRVGDGYVLAWDREGLAALEQRVKEAVLPLTTDISSDLNVVREADAWVKLISDLPFAPDDPLALTTDQRTKLLLPDAVPPPNPDPDAIHSYKLGTELSVPSGRTIPFSEMTPDQQAYLRSRLPAATMRIFSPDMSDPAAEPSKRPMTQEDLAEASFEDEVSVEVYVQLPDFGWVRISPDWGQGHIYGGQLDDIRRARQNRATVSAADKPAPSAKPVTPLPAAPPYIVRAPDRVLMVPPLSADRMPALAVEMKKHGFNTLFYPVLYGGYVTFPSQAFPLHPTLHGRDGLAAAAAAMKPRGIRVVGYFNTLAWQMQGDRAHWLSNHPDWLDLDALGRTRLTWLEQFPDADCSELVTVPANFVNPCVPAVVQRLEICLREVSRRTGIDGIAFAQWKPSDAMDDPDDWTIRPPTLGFSVAERRASLDKTWRDPVDRASGSPILSPHAMSNWSNAVDFEGGRAKALSDARLELVTRLLKASKEARKDWQTYLIDDYYAESMFRYDANKQPVPPADVIVRLPGFQTTPGKRAGVLIVADSGDTAIDPSDVNAAESNLSMALKYSLNGRDKGLPVVVLDLRKAPEEVLAAVRTCQAPSATPPLLRKR